MTQVLFASDTTPSLVDLDANMTELFDRAKIFLSSGSGVVTTTIPVGSINPPSAFFGGGLVLIKGAGNLSGIAFVRAYLVAIRVLGGGAPDLAQVTVASAGEAGEVFTFGASGGFVTITPSGTTPGHFSAWFIGA